MPTNLGLCPFHSLYAQYKALYAHFSRDYAHFKALYAHFKRSNAHLIVTMTISLRICPLFNLFAHHPFLRFNHIVYYEYHYSRRMIPRFLVSLNTPLILTSLPIKIMVYLTFTSAPPSH
jgi:hypothetical protein